MKRPEFKLCLVLGGILAATATSTARGAQEPSPEEPIQVCCTVPTLAALVREIGGRDVVVTTFAKPTEDAHFVDPRPSFLRELHEADLLVLNGLDLELGWLPPLIQNARNAGVLPGSPGYVDASTVITPLEVARGPVDRSLGDVHPSGNPHYLLDPLQGLRVAQLIQDRLGRERPAHAAEFSARFDALKDRLARGLAGDAVVDQHGSDFVVKLCALQERGGLAEFLQSQGLVLQGWLGKALEWEGTPVVADHNLWPYFARRFGLSLAGFLEPKPGLTPTSRHMTELVTRMRREGITRVLTSPYFDTRFLQFVEREADATLVPLAHEVGAAENTGDYASFVAHNFARLEQALERGSP